LHTDFIILKISDMRKIFFTLLTGIFFCINFATAQLTITMSSSEVDQGQTATVDVTVSGFTNLASTEYSINYDSTVLEFLMFSNVNSQLDGLANGISGPIGSNLKKGQIVVSWFNSNGQTLPNNTRIFSIVFRAIGARGTKSDVATSDVPRKIEITNVNLNFVQLTNVKGTVTIKADGPPPPPPTCVDPVCTNPNALTFRGAEVTASKDQIICVPITVRNFKSMQSGQGSIKWDPTVIEYIETKIPATGGIPQFSAMSNINANIANGDLRYVWFNNDVANPVTLPDNAVIMELCFKVLASTGTGCIQIGIGSLETIWEDDKGVVPVCYSYGKINIGTVIQTPVKIKTGTASGKKGDTVCVDVTVEDFKDVFAIGSRFGWDPTQLRFIRTEAYGLDGMNGQSFNMSNNSLNLAWNVGNALTRPNGHVIFKICFELLCPGTSNYTANVNVTGPTDVTGTINNVPATVPSTATGGSIAINCIDDPNPVCTVGTITPVACNGQSNGSVAITVTNGNACNYQWKTSAGTIIKSGAVSAGNLTLTGVGAGAYTFEVVCNGTVSTTCSATITQPSVIAIPNAGVVTNAACGGKGAININATSGGNGGYQYTWNPAQGNIPNPSGLDAGTYSVTVTDSKGCTATGSFTVGNTQTALSPVTLTPTNVKCNGGSDGRIVVTVTGGCTPYNYSWTGGLSGANPQNLRAGSYTVTVSDSATPAQTGTATVTITEPTPVVITVSGITEASTSTASDGKINLTISGGTANYRTMWSGGIPDGQTSGTLEVDKLKTGTYNVTVTDANGCTAVRNGIEVPVITDPIIGPELGTVSVTSNFTGFGIKCFGETNGVISGVLTKGDYPITVTLRSGTNIIGSPQVISVPNFTFSNLPAGTFTVTAMNATGSVVSQAITITQPSRLNATVTRNCSEKNKETGSIEINMGNTGAGNYGYVWQNLSVITNKAEGLGEGFYNITVTDANGCELRLTNQEITECPIGGECYTAMSIITPNGDQFNDLFIINCVDKTPADLSVFDRWGKLVYSQANYDNTWQGLDSDNRELLEGAYIWVLNINFGQGRREIYKGTVTLLRGE
jgi:gliding motility-associated-like protein